VADRKNRVVNFRVTQKEYERLRVASTLQGDRALSSYARQATLLAAAGKHGAELFAECGPGSATDLLEVCRRLTELESKVEELRLLDNSAK
jgi:hypothetical protein